MYFPITLWTLWFKIKFSKPIFTFNFPCKRALPVILSKLKFPPSIDAFIKFIRLNGFGEEKYQIFSCIFTIFAIISP